MRTVFTLAALAGLLLAAPTPVSARPPKKAAAAPATRVIGPVVEVSGHAADADEARNQAMKNAQEQVAELLAERLGVSSARVFPVEELRRLGVIQSVADPTPSRAKVLVGQPLVEVRCRVALTEGLVRAAKAEARQGVLLRVILALVVVFAVVCGYLRLEETTRGYATKLLRLLVSLVLLAAGLILWLTW